MIIVPLCLMCKHYNDGKCVAYPEGISNEELGNNDKKKYCGNTKYGFEKWDVMRTGNRT